MIKITHVLSWITTEDNRIRMMRDLVQAGEKYVVLTSSLMEEGCRKTENLLDFHTLLKKEGLEFADAHAPWGTFSDPGMPLNQYHYITMDRLKMAIRFCALFGVRTLTFHTGNTLNSVFGKDLTLDDYYRALIRSLEGLLPLAEKCNVTLALENQWTPLNHSSVLLRTLDYFNSPYLGLCYDTGHGNLTEKGSVNPEKSVVPWIWNDLGVPVKWEENLIEKFQPYMVNCHITDNYGLKDEHNLPLHGNIDWQRIRTVLKNAPRLQVIQNECVKPRGMSAGKFSKTFRQCLGL